MRRLLEIIEAIVTCGCFVSIASLFGYCAGVVVAGGIRHSAPLLVLIGIFFAALPIAVLGAAVLSSRRQSIRRTPSANFLIALIATLGGVQSLAVVLGASIDSETWFLRVIVSLFVSCILLMPLIVVVQIVKQLAR